MREALSHVQLFMTPWTVAHQAPLSMGFPRQEYWSGLPFPPPGDLPDLEGDLRLLHWLAASRPTELSSHLSLLDLREGQSTVPGKESKLSSLRGTPI